MITGIIWGFLTALLQSLSYFFSAKYMEKGRTSLQLVFFSQLFMGACCIPLLFWVFPIEIESLSSYILWVLCWVIVLSLGQWGFFNTLSQLEASKLSSLLGLKIIVLSFICVVILRENISFLRWIAVILSTLAAVGMNYSGGHRYTRKSLILLALTLIFYSLADISETHLINMIKNENVIIRAIKTSILCYFVLGVFSLFLLKKISWKANDFFEAAPFSACWFFSQFALFVCFGTIGPLFGNVIQSSRGIISIGLAAGLAAIGIGIAEPKVSKKQWLKRTAIGILMAIAIIIFALG